MKSHQVYCICPVCVRWVGVFVCQWMFVFVFFLNWGGKIQLNGTLSFRPLSCEQWKTLIFLPFASRMTKINDYWIKEWMRWSFLRFLPFFSSTFRSHTIQQQRREKERERKIAKTGSYTKSIQNRLYGIRAKLLTIVWLFENCRLGGNLCVCILHVIRLHFPYAEYSIHLPFAVFFLQRSSCGQLVSWYLGETPRERGRRQGPVWLSVWSFFFLPSEQ